ncbi:uncharacterized protein [Montipora capricornis]|uniref:uncharacterized protein n=1 Tax=Montipora capricornis TaxID=246305 RepID=UPI0035F1E8EB
MRIVGLVSRASVNGDGVVFILHAGTENGKIVMQLAGNNNYQCQYMYFSRPFPNGYLPVRVFTSINHGNNSAEVHDSVLVWMEDVSTTRFKACIVAGGQGSGANSTIDWLAFQGYQPGVQHGQARFALFTTGTKCTQVTFSQAFSTQPEVQATIQHGNLDQRKDAMNVWIESVSRTQFVVCLRESRTFDGPHSNLIVNWMAYEHYPTLWKVKESSKILFSKYEIPLAQDNYALCKIINFTGPFYEPPNVLTTAVKGIKNNSNPLSAVNGPLTSWVEEINRTHFRVCIKDYAGIDGQRDNLEVHYVVTGDYDPCNNASCKYHSKPVALSPQRCDCVCESSCPSYQEEMCASNGRTFRNLCLLQKQICQTHANYTHYHPGSCAGFEVVCISSESNLERVMRIVKLGMDCIALKWNEQKCAVVHAKRGCVKQTENMEIDELKTIKSLGEESAYTFLGVLENSKQEHNFVLRNASKEYLRRRGHWRSRRRHSIRTTRARGRGLKQLELEYMTTTIGLQEHLEYKTSTDNMMQLPTYSSRFYFLFFGFPLQKGRHQFKNHPSWAEDQCETIQFKPFVFYPHQKIFIQLTVNHVNYSDLAYVHEATTHWVESVNSTQFTACVTRAGRNDYPSDSFATVDWVAHQGAPPGGIAGEEKFSRWWTGTSCQTVTLPSGKFSSQPTVFVTPEHYRSSLKHDAASVWLEDVSARSFKICIRELQNFAGVHDDISVNWLAFETLHRPLFSEHNDVNFTNEILPSKSNNFAFCQDVNFTRTYNNYPIVILSAKHSSGGGNTSPHCNGIVSWIEFISSARFRICIKELFVQRFDPLTVSYAVLADICPDDWMYFKGYCYQKASSCDSWSNGQSRCATLGANLPSVHNQEENVFLQTLHNGENGWLGLSDINSEGTFVWSDGTRFDFHYWATNQPNNFRNEDCVHTLGSLQAHKFKWNDVNCSSCHKYSCKKDFNECQAFSHDCPKDSTCKNTDGSYTCQCHSGAPFDGRRCSAFEAVFTNLGATGRLGPSSLGGYYSGQDHDGQVTLVSGIQHWVVPYTADYKIEAVGAAGGFGKYSTSRQYRGRGARMIGIFSLVKGEKIKILVGQEGGINRVGQSAGGGGGTFVVRGSNTPLIIAGGGGGGESVQSRHTGCDASTSTSGRAGYRSWSGGSGGHGATTADNSNSGGGGGGFYSSGRSSKQFGGSMGNGGEGGKGFLQGGVGGRAWFNNIVGGFGGGGGGAYGIGGGAGGGGGYSGGSSGDNESDSCGGGGGSYNAGKNQQNECCYNTAGHGRVTITLT